MTEAKYMNTGFWEVFYSPALEYDDAALGSGCGKWMHTFLEDGREYVRDACRRAVESGAAWEAKMSTPEQIASHGYETGVACFYINGHSDTEHRKLLEFMLAEGLFPYDESGCLRDADFKFDWQTRAGMYDESSGYVPQVMLSDYVNLDTGEFI